MHVRVNRRAWDRARECVGGCVTPAGCDGMIMLRPDGLLVHYAWESSVLFSTIKIKNSDSELFNNHNWETNLHNTAILTICYGDLFMHHCQSLTAYTGCNCDIQKLQRLESNSCLLAKTGTSMYSQVYFKVLCTGKGCMQNFSLYQTVNQIKIHFCVYISFHMRLIYYQTLNYPIPALLLVSMSYVSM